MHPPPFSRCSITATSTSYCNNDQDRRGEQFRFTPLKVHSTSFATQPFPGLGILADGRL
jgi:hypothetical protein